MSKRILGFFIFLVCGLALPSLSGLLIFSALPIQLTIPYTFVIAIIFLSITIFLRSQRSIRCYWQVFFAFFIASTALIFDFLVNMPSNTMTGLALDMLVSTLIVVSTIIFLTVVSGNSLGSIYLKKGNVKLGLIIGLAGFFFFALTSIPAAQYLFLGQNLSIQRVIAWLPWIIPIVLLNGLREELLYRGLFLRKFQLKLGSKTSNLLQAIIFSLSHSVAGVGLNAYTPYIWGLVIFTFSLGLAWGYIMQRTDSILGSALFHAGTDIPVFIGIFSNTF
jgi:uncharacterized protein